MVDHGDGHIPAMHCAVHRSRHASSRARLHIPCILIHGKLAGGSEPGSSILVKAVAVVSLPVRDLVEWRRVQKMARRRLRHGDVDITRQFCWGSSDRDDPRCFRVVPGGVAGISDPFRLHIH